MFRGYSVWTYTGDMNEAVEEDIMSPGVRIILETFTQPIGKRSWKRAPK